MWLYSAVFSAAVIAFFSHKCDNCILFFKTPAFFGRAIIKLMWQSPFPNELFIISYVIMEDFLS